MATELIALHIDDSLINWYVPDEGPEIKTCVRLSSLCTTIFAIFFFNVSVGTNSNISKKRLAALSIFVAD